MLGERRGDVHSAGHENVPEGYCSLALEPSAAEEPAEKLASAYLFAGATVLTHYETVSLGELNTLAETVPLKSLKFAVEYPKYQAEAPDAWAWLQLPD